MTESKMESIRILIADDHDVVRIGLRALITTKPGVELVGEAVNGVEVVQKARSLQPDVILLDLMMPRKDGIQATREIMRENADARILILTSFAQDDKVFPAIKAGALGYLLKDSSPQELLQAIRDVHEGKPSLHPTIALRLMREMEQPSDLKPTVAPLTEREMQVLRRVARGSTNREIGEALDIRQQTVGTHVSNILGKLHLANRTQAALYALREGITPL